MIRIALDNRQGIGGDHRLFVLDSGWHIFQGLRWIMSSMTQGVNSLPSLCIQSKSQDRQSVISCHQCIYRFAQYATGASLSVKTLPVSISMSTESFLKGASGHGLANSANSYTLVGNIRGIAFVLGRPSLFQISCFSIYLGPMIVIYGLSYLPCQGTQVGPGHQTKYMQLRCRDGVDI